MAERILYFTARSVPTEGELTEIDALRALAEKPYQVTIHNGDMEPNYVAPGDYAMGSIPSAYEDLPVFDIEAAQAPDLEPGQAIVSDGDTLSTASGTVTLNVSDGTVTATYAAN